MNLGPLELESPPDVARNLAERRELMRIAAVRALELHKTAGHLDADELRIARHWASVAPLQGPMGTWE